MKLLILPAVFALLALALPAAAQPAAGFAFPALAGRQLLTGCRQGQCAWMRVDRLERTRRTPRGELRRLTNRIGTSISSDLGVPGRRPRIEWERESRTDYIFCSRARPAYAFPDDDGSYILHYLDLFDLAGYQQSSGLLYMRICHDRGVAGTAALRRLGYRPGARNEQVEGARPEDLERF